MEEGSATFDRAAADSDKHFRGTPEERFLLAHELGRKALKFFLAGLPEGADREAAVRRLRETKHADRRAKILPEEERT